MTQQRRVRRRVVVPVEGSHRHAPPLAARLPEDTHDHSSLRRRGRCRFESSWPCWPLLLSAACTDAAPVRPTTPVVEVVDFQLTGIVTDDDGTAMAGAVVDIGFVAPDRSWHYVHAVTNQSGVYAAAFTALRGVKGSVLGGPALTQDAAALAWAYAPGCAGPSEEAQPGCAHDPDTRYIASNSPQATQNFRLRRMTRIGADNQPRSPSRRVTGSAGSTFSSRSAGVCVLSLRAPAR